MITDSDLEDLQESLAWIDLASQQTRSDYVELMVIRRDHVKLRMRPEDNHALPHFHLEYKRLHSASYQIEPLRKLAGDMPKKYEKKLSDWISKNRENLLATWTALKAGNDIRELVIARAKE